MQFRILAIDDEAMALETLRLVLASETDIEMQTTNSFEEAIRLVRAEPNGFAVVLIDFKMPKMDGAQLTRALLTINPNLQIVMHSGDLRRETMKASYAAGIRDFIDKDTDPIEFRARIRQLCLKFEDTVQTFEPQDLPDENEKLIRSINMIGKSKALAEVAALVHQVASSTCNVLIHGSPAPAKNWLLARFTGTRRGGRNRLWRSMSVRSRTT